MSTEWLSLIEYRNKYNVSVSTLRRRIRDEAIKFQLVRGKYFIYDEPIELENAAPTNFQPQIEESFEESAPVVPTMATAATSQESLNSVLLKELKQAYQKILKEKEEQIFILREEVTNLQTLVHVLEEENERLSYVERIHATRPK